MVFYQPEENSKGTDDVVDTRSRFGLNEPLLEPSQGTVHVTSACLSDQLHFPKLQESTFSLQLMGLKNPLLIYAFTS